MLPSLETVKSVGGQIDKGSGSGVGSGVGSGSGATGE